MLKKNIPKIQEATNNTTTEQVKAKIFIFLWILMFVVVMILSIVMYDPKHRVMFTLLPIAMAFPCAMKVNKNVRKLNDEKEREKIFIRRDADSGKKKPSGTNKKKK
jgi:hypothetical protein